MNKQRVYPLVTLVVLTTIAAVLVWRLAMDSQSLADANVAVTPSDKPPHIDQSTETLKQISDSLVIAKRENRQVLLQFGSRGCSWCHLLHNVFEKDAKIVEELKSDYVVVMVDVSDGNNKAVNDKFGNPTRGGLPVTVILDSDGKLLMTENIAFADEEALRQKTCRIDTEKVLACLNKWSSKKNNTD